MKNSQAPAELSLCFQQALERSASMSTQEQAILLSRICLQWLCSQQEKKETLADLDLESLLVEQHTEEYAPVPVVVKLPPEYAIDLLEIARRAGHTLSHQGQLFLLEILDKHQRGAALDTGEGRIRDSDFEIPCNKN